MRVALYARVSTLNGQNPEMQLAELREYASQRGWEVVREYVDAGVSGAKVSRPALNQMMADAHRRRFAVLLVWKIDRFGRSLRHLVNALADLDALGVSFVSLHDSLDLGTASGRLMFQVVAAMAEFERALTQERVRAGLRLARSRGKRLGRPRAGVNPELVSAMRQQGDSWRVISERLGVGVGTACRALQGRSKMVSSMPPANA